MNFNVNFHGKRVLVTGSTMGIGRGVAEALHSLGATVAINGRTPASVSKTIEEIGGHERLIAAPGDLSKVALIRAVIPEVINRMGGLDILINNAGRGDDVLVDDVSETYWEEMLALNLKGAFFSAQTCLPALKQSRGSIVNVSSAFGVMGGYPGTLVYSITKTAMIQMTRMMAVELAETGVRVNTLVPGWIDTAMVRGADEQVGGALLRDICRTTPMGRPGTIKECAGAIIYLCAPWASYTTGSMLVADGAISAGHYV
jgi:NAD(P)-dependent dehydrogenase (short-subunit alcohol dehydrogenase family)